MLSRFTFGGRREGKAKLMAFERDCALERGETVVIASHNDSGGVHFCTIKSFAREKLRRKRQANETD